MSKRRDISPPKPSPLVEQSRRLRDAVQANVRDSRQLIDCLHSIHQKSGDLIQSATELRELILERKLLAESKA